MLPSSALRMKAVTDRSEQAVLRGLRLLGLNCAAVYHLINLFYRLNREACHHHEGSAGGSDWEEVHDDCSLAVAAN